MLIADRDLASMDALPRTKGLNVNGIATPMAREPGPLVTRWRSLGWRGSSTNRAVRSLPGGARPRSPARTLALPDAQCVEDVTGRPGRRHRLAPAIAAGAADLDGGAEVETVTVSGPRRSGASPSGRSPRAIENSSIRPAFTYCRIVAPPPVAERDSAPRCLISGARRRWWGDRGLGDHPPGRSNRLPRWHQDVARR
jgi:hypothetical protein